MPLPCRHWSVGPLVRLLLVVLLSALGGWLPARAAAQETATAAPADSGEAATADIPGDAAEPFDEPPHDLAYRLFFDFRLAVFTRDVDFSSQSERSSGGDQTPHWAIGFGVFFPEGFNYLLGDELGDLIGPLGVRIGYMSGGSFSPGGDALDLDNADDDAFKTEELEIGLFGGLAGRGRGVDLIITDWEFFGELSIDANFRGATIPAGTRMRQAIMMLGITAPLTLFDDLLIGLDETASHVGVRIRYEFLQLSLEARNPDVKGSEANHAFLFGTWIDWGVLEWLKFDADLDIGAIVRSPSGVVVHFRMALVFMQPVPFWLDDHLELLARLEFDVTMTNLGDRYLHDPASTGDRRGAIVWLKGSLQLGLRVWF